MELSRDEVQQIAELAAARAVDKAVQKVESASPLNRIGRDELQQLINETAERTVKKVLKTIGLDADNSGETAAKIVSLFKLQHNIGTAVLWAAIGVISAAIIGIGTILSAPWRKYFG